MTTAQHQPAVLYRCRTCGRSYAPGVSARINHQNTLGHRPEPAVPTIGPDAWGLLTRDCASGNHQLCDLDGQPGGVLVGPGVTAECGCACHRPGGPLLSSRCLRAAHSQCTGLRNGVGRREQCECRCHRHSGIEDD